MLRTSQEYGCLSMIVLLGSILRQLENILWKNNATGCDRVVLWYIDKPANKANKKHTLKHCFFKQKDERLLERENNNGFNHFKTTKRYCKMTNLQWGDECTPKRSRASLRQKQKNHKQNQAQQAKYKNQTQNELIKHILSYEHLQMNFFSNRTPLQKTQTPKNIYLKKKKNETGTNNP